MKIAVCIIPEPTHSVVRRRLYGTGRFDLIAPARGGSPGFRSEFCAALVALCRRVPATAHSRIVPLGNLRKLRPPCAPQPPTHGSVFRERALNTVQTDTRRRCSNTPSLAALPVATTLRSHHRAHSRSRHRTTPGRGTTATLTGVNRLSRIVYRDMAAASINHKRYTINARYADTPCRHQGAHRGRQSPCGLQPALHANAEYRWARLSWRYRLGASLGEDPPQAQTPCGR